MRPVLGAALAALCLTAGMLPDSTAALLEFDRGRILQGEIGRLWTAHIVHYSIQHLLFDSLLLFLTTALAERGPGRRRTLLLLMLGAPLVSCAVLYLVPDMAHYRGTSALAVMMGVAAGTDFWRREPACRPLLLAAAALGMLKIAWDAGGGDAGFAGLPPGIAVAWQAHAAAALTGCALLSAAFRRTSSRAA